jgi:RNA polymerase sigma-70 factor (ECF subfamily)
MKFDFIWKEYEKELSSFVRARFFDKSLSSDLMQEVAIKIFKNKKQLSSIENIRAWLYKITRNTLIDFYKKNDKAIPDDLYTSELTQSYDESIENELFSCLQNMASLLKQTDKEILDLSIVEQYSINEISSKLNLSYDGTKSKLKRAKKKLASEFFSCCNLEKDTQGKIIDFKAINDKKCIC